MKDQESNDNWQLEEGNQVDDRWVLRESEQQFADQWELNRAEEDEPIRDWQPVEYERPERSGLAWVLPVLITVFLLALIGYSGFILLPQIISPGDPESPIVTTTETPEPDAEDPAPVDGPEPDEPVDPPAPVDETPTDVEPPAEVQPDPVDDEVDDADEPTAPEPQTPSNNEQGPTQQTPAEPAVWEQEFATVITTYGVNARNAPSADGQIVRILNQGESFFLFGSPAEGWLELLVTEEDVELVEGEPIEGEVAYAAAEFFDIDSQTIMRGFYEEIMEFADRTPEPDPTDTVVEVPDATTPDDTDEPVDATEPEPVTIQVDSPAGLNVRSQPNTTGDIVGLLNEGDTVPALAVSADEEWIQVELEDGAIGWVFAEFVTVDGNLSDIGASPLPPAAAPGIIQVSDVMTSGIVPPSPYSSIIPGETPAVVVAVADGAIARLQPDPAADELTLLPQGAALAAVSRSADGDWIEIEMPDGNLNGWVARAVVSVTPDIDTLPVDGEADEADATTDTEAEEPGDNGPLLVPTPTPQPVGAANGDDENDVDPGTDTNNDEEPTATVRDILLSVYPEPNSDGNSIALIPRGTIVPVAGRNADSDWILIETEDGDTGWVPVRSVILSVNVDSLPVEEA